MIRFKIKRDEIVHHDNLEGCIHNSLVDFRLPQINKKSYLDLRIEVYSKSGNSSRVMYLYPVELEGISGIFYWSHSKLKIKKSAIVILDGKVISIEPVARLKYNGDVIYRVDK